MSYAAAESAVVRRLRVSAQVQHHLSRELSWGSARLQSWAVLLCSTFFTSMEIKPTSAISSYFFCFFFWMTLSCGTISGTFLSPGNLFPIFFFYLLIWSINITICLIAFLFIVIFFKITCLCTLTDLSLKEHACTVDHTSIQSTKQYLVTCLFSFCRHCKIYSVQTTFIKLQNKMKYILHH